VEIEMTVRLVIPDTTAITAFHTLERMGFPGLRKLKREDYYLFSIDGDDFEAAVSELGNTDILVNANKHMFTARCAGEPFGGDEDGLLTVRLLVEDMDNKDGGLLPVLRERLGLDYVKSMRKGTLWSLGIDSKSSEDAKKTAVRIAEDLLANKHYQQYRIIGGEKRGRE
jgi:phosphoribosylformylglycinamidine (FGAM) synthase PurS component